MTAKAGNIRLEKPVYPTAGNHPKVTAKIRTRIDPVQKTGADCPNIATAEAIEAHADRGLCAANDPKRIAIDTEINRAVPASARVFGNVSQIKSATGD
jgi:hypothetical protein